jgi:hypothetical protein
MEKMYYADTDIENLTRCRAPEYGGAKGAKAE